MPEVTANFIRLPTGNKCTPTATITISQTKGIAALYCGDVKKIRTYLFERSKGWTMDSAKEWIEKHKPKKQMEKSEEHRIWIVSKPAIEDQDQDIEKSRTYYSNGVDWAKSAINQLVVQHSEGWVDLRPKMKQELARKVFKQMLRGHAPFEKSWKEQALIWFEDKGYDFAKKAFADLSPSIKK